MREQLQMKIKWTRPDDWGCVHGRTEADETVVIEPDGTGRNRIYVIHYPVHQLKPNPIAWRYRLRDAKARAKQLGQDVAEDTHYPSTILKATEAA